MKFICFGYLDLKTWGTKSENERTAMFDKCLSYDDYLKKNGHWVSGEGLQGPDTAATLRYQNGKAGSFNLRNCASAIVRSARHSSPRY